MLSQQGCTLRIRPEVEKAIWEPLTPIGGPGNLTVQRLAVRARAKSTGDAQDSTVSLFVRRQ